MMSWALTCSSHLHQGILSSMPLKMLLGKQCEGLMHDAHFGLSESPSTTTSHSGIPYPFSAVGAQHRTIREMIKYTKTMDLLHQHTHDEINYTQDLLRAPEDQIWDLEMAISRVLPHKNSEPSLGYQTALMLHRITLYRQHQGRV